MKPVKSYQEAIAIRSILIEAGIEDCNIRFIQTNRKIFVWFKYKDIKIPITAGEGIVDDELFQSSFSSYVDWYRKQSYAEQMVMLHNTRAYRIKSETVLSLSANNGGSDGAETIH